MSSLSLNRVRKSFGAHEVIKDIDLSIREGEFVVFVGPSGCGKSTLLRMIAGLEEITSGEVRIGPRVVDHLPPSRRGIAMVFQSYALYPHMSVDRNMGFNLELARVPKPTIRKKVAEAARVLQIGRLLDRRPRELSGGQRQRVAIGRAIVRKPEVFLFDEPLSNLDAALRVQMRIEIARLHAELGATMIYVTHDQTEAMTLADRIVVLNEGRVEQVGSPLELYHSPRNRFVAGFIGSPRMNFLDVQAEAGAGAVVAHLPGGGRLAVPVAGRPPAGALTLGIRPDDVRLVPAAEAQLAGRVVLVERLGASSHLHVDLGAPELFVAVVPGERPVRVGENLAIGLSPELVHLFGEDGAAVARPGGRGHAVPVS